MHDDPTQGVVRLEPPPSTPALYAQDGKGYDAIVYAHLFLGSSDWLITEYGPNEQFVFGWCCLNGDRQNAELGYTDLAELASVRVPFGVNAEGRATILRGVAVVERDADWPVGLTLTQGIALLDQRQGVVA